MPICKNDPKKSYKGTEPIKKTCLFYRLSQNDEVILTEPSPKGLGFCAHAEKLGSTKKGIRR